MTKATLDNTTGKPAGDGDRKARLAAELRANLQKRKSQSRQRKSEIAHETSAEPKQNG